MAGIFGAWAKNRSFDRTRAESEMLMCARQGFLHPSGSYTIGNNFVGLAAPNFFGRPSTPIISEDLKYALALFGELYLPSGSPLRSENFDRDFLSPFLLDPEAYLRRTDGAFVFALISDDVCWIVTDPFGNFALHYSETEHAFLFASQMEAIRKTTGNRHLNEAGIGEYLSFGYTLNGRTPFNDIQRLPNATILKYDRSGATLSKYYKPEYSADNSALQTNLDAITDALNTSVSRRSEYSNAMAALTGGFDSRATWSLLLKQNRKLTAHTHGLPDSNDIRIAHTIAGRLNLTTDIFLFTDRKIEEIPSEWETIVRLSEGGISIAHAPTVVMWKHLADRAPVVLDSYGGAFYRRQRMKIAELRIDQRKDLIPQLLHYEAISSRFIRKEIAPQLWIIAENALREYYDSIEETPLLGDKLDRFHMEQIDTMRDSLGGNAQMNFVGLAHPLLHLQAFDRATKLPILSRRNDAVHKHVIRSSCAALQDFPLDNVGFTAPYRGFSTLRYGAMAAEKLIRILSSIGLSPLNKVTLRRPTMNAEHLLLPVRAFLREMLLSPHSTYDRYFDRTEIGGSLNRLDNGDLADANAIIQAVSARIFFEIFT